MAVVETLLHPFATAKIVVWSATCSVRGGLVMAARSRDATLCACGRRDERTGNRCDHDKGSKCLLHSRPSCAWMARGDATAAPPKTPIECSSPHGQERRPASPLNASTVGVHPMSFSGSETRPVGFLDLKSNLSNRPLRPFVGFRKPKFSTVAVKQSPFSAQQFLIANFRQFTNHLCGHHQPTSSGRHFSATINSVVILSGCCAPDRFATKATVAMRCRSAVPSLCCGPLDTSGHTKSALCPSICFRPKARIEVIFDMAPISFSFEQSDHAYTPQEISHV